MSKIKLFFLIALLPIALCASYRERVKHVHLVQDLSKDPNDQRFIDEGSLKCLKEAMLLKQTYLKVTDLKNEKDTQQLTYVMVWNKPNFLKQELKKFPSKKAILYMWEPPVVQPKLYSEEYTSQFKRIYTWNDDLVDNKKYFKLYFPVFQTMHPSLPSFKERKLLTQISSDKKSQHPQELYSARADVIQYFQDQPEGDFEFYGHGWDAHLRHYKGAPEDKHAALKNYKFSICYESMCDVKGYISEKIFDCFAVGTVPIYWGASNITDYIPKECFIDRRDFKTFEDVLSFIQTIDAQTFKTYQKNIQLFLESDKAKLFSQEMFNVLFLESIRFP